MQHSTTKDRLYAAARHLFSERGYAATTVRDIAEEVGIRGASLYAHMSGKEELLWELVASAADLFTERLRPIASSDLPAEERLRQAIAAHVEVIAEHIEAATIYFHEWMFLGARRRRAILERRDAYEALFRDMIADGVRDGSFRVEQPGLAATMLLSSLNGLAGWYRRDGALDAATLGALYADLMIGGLRAGSRHAPHVPRASRTVPRPIPEPTVQT